MTKEAKILVTKLYKEYVLRREDGTSIAKARFFGSSEDVQKNFSQMHFQTILPKL